MNLSLFHPQTLSISELTNYLRQLVESDEILTDLWVEGEISNLSMPASGHVYFTLKDSGAQLRCVIWRSSAQRLKPLLRNGAQVAAHGALGIYPDQGSYQLYIDGLRPAGEGLLYQEFLRLKAALEAEGLFDAERKRPIPERPRIIGIVTSGTGAALQDMLNTLQKRYPLAEVVLAPSAVQGEAAPLELVAAIRRLNQQAKPDVILLARGGGSLEDLWAFNDPRVVYAIIESDAPVITGIGHETDFTLADFAADFRAPTPTGAAVAATPDRDELRQELSGLAEQLAGLLENKLNGMVQYLETARARMRMVSPAWEINHARQRLDELSVRAEGAYQNRLNYQRLSLNGQTSRLAALNPLSVLKRGYAIISKPGEGIVHSVTELLPGSRLEIRLSDGQRSATVDNFAESDKTSNRKES